MSDLALNNPLEPAALKIMLLVSATRRGSLPPSR